MLSKAYPALNSQCPELFSSAHKCFTLWRSSELISEVSHTELRSILLFFLKKQIMVTLIMEDPSTSGKNLNTWVFVLTQKTCCASMTVGPSLWSYLLVTTKIYSQVTDSAEA